MKNYYKKIKILIFLLLLLFINLTPVFATTIPINQLINDQRKTTAGRAGYNTAETANSIVELRATYLKAVLSFLSVIFLGLIIYGGFIWMNAQGNAEEAGKAKTIIINASIGLVIILASYAISDYIIYNLVTVVAPAVPK
ncbi:MAG: hypothetical protein ABIC82_06545 [bacterium]